MKNNHIPDVPNRFKVSHCYKNRLMEANVLRSAGFVMQRLLLFVLFKVFHQFGNHTDFFFG